MILLPLRVALLALIAVLASGCATVTGRATQPVNGADQAGKIDAIRFHD